MRRAATRGEESSLLIGTSWKMTKTIGEARVYAEALRASGQCSDPKVTAFIVPPATCLGVVRDALGPHSPVLLGAQNAHWEDEGAWTGEISVPQAMDAGAAIIEIGHSERRRHFGENDRTVNLKVRACLRHEAVPLVCVGETATERDAGRAPESVVRQVERAFAGVPDARAAVVAYEPHWAIGAHGQAASRDHVAEVAAAVASCRGDAAPTVLYGGSVTVDNALDYLTIPGISGLFVGRAAWSVDGLVSILTMARALVA